MTKKICAALVTLILAALSQAQDANTPLKLSLTEASLLALENNTELLVQRYNPKIQSTFVQQELSVFDPVVRARLQQEQARLRIEHGSTLARDHATTGAVSIEEFLPTGTLLNLTGSTTLDEFGSDGDLWESSIAAGVTQALLRGAGTTVNLASVNQARLNVQVSEYELRGFTESLLARTQVAYWDYVLTLRRIEIFEKSLELARNQLEEVQERIRVGKLAPSEIAAAKAEVASRRQELIVANSNLEARRLEFLRLISPAGGLTSTIILTTLPTEPNFTDSVEEHLALAMQLRPDLNEARLRLKIDQLELVKTKNGMLPRLDLFINLGKTGYADSFGKSWNRTVTDNNYDLVGGVQFELSPINRGARAANQRAIYTRNQTKEAIKNLELLADTDVRQAFIEIKRTYELISATAATRQFRQQSADAEAEKFRVGKSTSILVAQAQRDLLLSQITEVDALVNHLISIIELYRLDGSLLERWGIRSPGANPVKCKL